MSTLTLPGARVATLWPALVVLLLALAGTPDSVFVDAAVRGSVVAMDQPQGAGPAADLISAAATDCPAHGAERDTEVHGSSGPSRGTGAHPVSPSAPAYPAMPPASDSAEDQHMRERAIAHTDHDPILRGISRT